jgi:protein-tyrosine phosphatase
MGYLHLRHSFTSIFIRLIKRDGMLPQNPLVSVSNPADEIIPGLWLGNRTAALDPQFLTRERISTVFNCTKDIPFHSLAKKRYRISVDDNLQEEEIRNLELWSYEIVYKMGQEYKSGSPILVHCAAGMQRSAACVVMFLIVLKNMTPDQAIAYVKSKRPVAFFGSVNFGRAIDSFYESYQKEYASILHPL